MDLHNHKGVKVLDAVEDGLGEVCALVDVGLGLACAEEGRGLSIIVISVYTGFTVVFFEMRHGRIRLSCLLSQQMGV